MPLLENIYAGIAAFAAAQQLGIVPEFGDIVSNVLADSLTSVTANVLNALRGDANHDFDKLLAAALADSVQKVKLRTNGASGRRAYWRDTQRRELEAMRAKALSIISDPGNSEHVDELIRSLLVGEKGSVEQAVLDLIAPLVDSDRADGCAMIPRHVAEEFFKAFNDKYKSRDHVKGRIAFELLATRAISAESGRARASNAVIEAKLDEVLSRLHPLLEQSLANGDPSPFDYEIAFDDLIGNMSSLREQLTDYQRDNSDRLSRIDARLDGLMASHLLVASNLPPLSGMLAGRLTKQTEIESVLTASKESPRIVSLHGPGGYGKSILAVMYAHSGASRDLYGNRRWIINCANRTPTEVIASLLVPTRDNGSLHENARTEIVRALLQQKRSLLILDNIADEQQWNSFLESGLLACQNLDVLATSRRTFNKCHGHQLNVDRLTSDEIEAILIQRRPELLEPHHASSLTAFAEETEGMALLVSAVAAVLEDPEVDIVSFTSALKSMPLDQLPSADEVDPPNSRRVDRVLTDYYERLQPPLKRIAEYAFFLRPDKVGKDWLEWLLRYDSAPTIDLNHRIDVGCDKAGHPRSPAAIVDEAIRLGLLRPADTDYLQFHRLHRKWLDGTFKPVAWHAHLVSLMQLVQDLITRGEHADESGDIEECLRLTGSVVVILEGLSTAITIHESMLPQDLQSYLSIAYGRRGFAHHCLGQFVAALADDDRAIAILEEAVETQRNSAPTCLLNTQVLLAAHYGNRAFSRLALSRNSEGIADLSRAIEIFLEIRQSSLELGEDIPLKHQYHYHLAQAYLNKGYSLMSFGLHADADEAYGNALDTFNEARDAADAAGEKLTVKLRELEARIQMKLGAMYSSQGLFVDSDIAYGRANEIWEDIRKECEALGSQWPISTQSNTANSYCNRGAVRKELGRYADADADYGRAVQILEGIGHDFAELGKPWPITLQHCLAVAHINRSVLHCAASRYADSDIASSRAIEICNRIQDAFAASGHPQPVEMQATAAAAFQARGNSRLHQGRCELSARDYRRATDILESVREFFSTCSEAWPIELQQQLAGAHVNLGNALHLDDPYVATDAHYDRAVEILEGLTDAFASSGMAAPIKVRETLAFAFLGWGSSRLSRQRYAEADFNLGLAIGLFQKIHDELTLSDNGRSCDIQIAIADAYCFRGNSQQDQNQHVTAEGDFSCAIESREQLRHLLTAQNAWLEPHRDRLGDTYRKRAACRRALHNWAGGEADESRALAIDKLDDSGTISS